MESWEIEEAVADHFNREWEEQNQADDFDWEPAAEKLQSAIDKISDAVDEIFEAADLSKDTEFEDRIDALGHDTENLVYAIHTMINKLGGRV